MTAPVGDPVPFAALPGFEEDDAGAAFATFHRSAIAAAEGQAPLRPALGEMQALAAAFAAARALGPCPSTARARQFFRDTFEPHPVDRSNAFFTGYYEPFVDGALDRSPLFAAPLLARPADLKTFAADEPRPPWAQDLAAARIAADGTLSPYPDRSAIEAAIGSNPFRPIVWLRDWVEVFLIQVQGSARVRLQDGTMLRISYAGRNGHPYTSIGRLLAEAGAIAPEAMSLARLKAWLRENGQEPGQPGRALMQRNASYVFFDATHGSSQAGPIGGAGLPLTPLRSIAVDRTLWCYGLPFWVDAMLPSAGEQATPFRRLMIAQDTGSAIVGPARVDLFFGSGDEAGRIAGNIRHRGSLTVLLPRPDPPP